MSSLVQPLLLIVINQVGKLVCVNLNNDINSIRKGKIQMKKLAIQLFIFGLFMTTHIIPVMACGGGGN